MVNNTTKLDAANTDHDILSLTYIYNLDQLINWYFCP